MALRETARLEGKTRFFTGIACKRNHVCERFVSNGLCVECARIAKNKDRLLNKEREKISRRQRYLSSEPDLEARAAAARAYYEANKDWLKPLKASYFKDWRLKNIEKVKRHLSDYRIENRERFQSYDRNRRAREKQCVGQHSAKEIENLYLKQKGKCAGCHVRIAFKCKHVDHIIPLAKNGSNDIANLQILCVPCNLSKGAKDPIIWAQSFGRLF